MGSNAWKNHERQVAKDFGGKRHLRGADFSEVAGDVDLPDDSPFQIECKYRAALPKIITETLRQARGYKEGKIPLAILKEKGKSGYIVCLSGEDFQTIVKASKL